MAADNLARDLFDLEAPASASPQAHDGVVAAGLATLAARPLWPVADWIDIVARVAAIGLRWDAEAETLGWSLLSRYGLVASAPYANLSGMGAWFLVARREHRIIAVERDVIRLVTRSSARLTIRRTAPHSGAVLAWEISAG